MHAALILLTLAALGLGTLGWLMICAGFRRSGWRGTVGRLAVQVSLLVLIYALLRGQPVNGVFMAMFAPLAVVQLVQLVPFGDFAGRLLWAALPFAGVALLVGLSVARLRMWTPVVVGSVVLVAAVIAGEGISKAAMCEAAARRGFDSFARHGVLWSLTNAPQEFQFGLHARAEVGGQVLGWSYADMDWYIVPESVARTVRSGPVVACDQAQ